jgi:hypothetical protein
MICAAAGLLLLAHSATAQPQLRHQLTPGWVSTYDVRVEIRQPNSSKAGASQELDTRTGVLTRAIFRDDPADSAICAQVLTIRRLHRPATRTQPASDRHKPEGPPDRVQLAVRRISSVYSEYLVPIESKRLQRLTQTITRVTFWPETPVSVGGSWKRPFALGSAKGEQRYQLDAIDRKGRDQFAKVTVITSFDDDVEFEHEQIVSARSELVWSISGRELISLDGRLTYLTPPETGAEEAAVHVTMQRTSQRRWTRNRRGDEREALIEMTRAVTAYRLDNESRVTDICERFLRQRRTSIFRPLAAYLARQVESRHKPLPIDALKERLVELLAGWHRSEIDSDVERREKLKSDFARLMEVNRTEIVRLLDDESADFRAVACFAIAFGEAPADIARIQKACSDPAEHVRQWAMSALALRGSTLTSQDVLIAGLDDPDPTVRRRACQAIETCTPEDSPAAATAIAAVAERLNDESADVVYAAAQALLRLGGESQIDRVRSTAENCADAGLAAALHRLLPPATQPRP